jgi:hypothetical protein
MTDEPETGERASQVIPGRRPVAGLDPVQALAAIRDLMTRRRAYVRIGVLPEHAKVALAGEERVPRAEPSSEVYRLLDPAPGWAVHEKWPG